MKKIIVSMFSTLFLGLTFLVSGAFATELTYEEVTSYKNKEEVILANEFNNISINQLKKQSFIYKNKIQELSDEEFDRFIYNVVSSNNKDVTELKKNLDLVGVELNMKDNSSSIAPLEIKPSQMTLQAYATKRIGDDYWRLQSQWTTNRTELYPATYDLVSIEWDPSVAKYYEAPEPSHSKVTIRSGSERFNGIYLYNVEDTGYFDSYVTVYVKKLSNNAVEFGTKYVHTYTTVETSISASANYQFNKGHAGGMSFTVNIKPKESFWELWTDNTLYW